MYLYNHILTCTKLATYSASVVKCNFGNFGNINSFVNQTINQPDFIYLAAMRLDKMTYKYTYCVQGAQPRFQSWGSNSLV